MAELIAKTPCGDFLPVTRGALELKEAEPVSMTALARFDNQDAATDKILSEAHGVGFPAPGQCTRQGNVRALWFGPDQAMLIGPAPAASLRDCCAVTDQSDAWCRVHLTGEGAEQVLARLVPIDLRLSTFGIGAVARTEVFHMAAVISRLSDAVFEIMVFRSMAETLVHDLDVAMKSVRAQSDG
ncbi:MAG: sarcosine oxidase subunit gamma [Pseudoruegeria sp.]